MDPVAANGSSGPGVLFCAVFLCLAVLVVFGGGGAFFYFFWKANLRSPGRLATWQADSLGDLAYDTNHRWSRVGRDLKFDGVIPAASSRKGSPLVAVHIYFKHDGLQSHSRGNMKANTTAQTLQFGVAPEAVTITSNGAPFGSVQPDGTLFNADGLTLGRIHRSGGAPLTSATSTPGQKPGDPQGAYPVILGGRQVAQIANDDSSLPEEFKLPSSGSKRAVVPEGLLSVDEATWVLALAIMQIILHEFSGPNFGYPPGLATMNMQ